MSMLIKKIQNGTVELVSAWAPAISISSPAFGKPMTFDFCASVVDVDMQGTSLVT